jgi:CRISPR-associated protein Csm4
VFSFAQGAGLWFIASLPESDGGTEVFESLLRSLQHSGIGGKRTAGLGRFVFTKCDFTSELGKFAGLVTALHTSGAPSTPHTPGAQYMALTTAFPADGELDQALNNATYLLRKSSGFAYSTTAEEAWRKKDLYKFSAGSVFEHPFNGAIFDVRPAVYNHIVHSFSRPIFLRIDQTIGEVGGVV